VADILQYLRKKHQSGRAWYALFINSSIRISASACCAGVARSRNGRKLSMHRCSLTLVRRSETGSGNARPAASRGRKSDVGPRRRSRYAVRAPAQVRVWLAGFRSSPVRFVRPQRGGYRTMHGFDRDPGSFGQRLARMEGLLPGSRALQKNEATASEKGQEPLELRLDPGPGLRPSGSSATFLNSRRERPRGRATPSQVPVPHRFFRTLGRPSDLSS